LGQIVGVYTANSSSNGFIYSDGAYTTLDDPLGVTTSLTGINDSGQIVGYYTDGSGINYGFIYNDGVFTTIDGPGGSTNSEVVGINDSGQILLVYNSASSYLATPAELFTSLMPNQQSAIGSGVDLYNGLGGNDVVTLPSVANYSESLGSSGGTLNWDPSQTFSTGSQVGDKYTVRGSDGNYNIALGAGSDTVTINGNGNSDITAGSGSGTITISGTGSNTVTGDLTGSVSVFEGGTVELKNGFVDRRCSSTVRARAAEELFFGQTDRKS
jgi:probable HAF family extracellular repeat protein